MYSQFFGFKSNPFSQTPPPGNDYLPSSHRLILYQLNQAIKKASSGLFLLLGPIGIGKTSLIKALVNNDSLKINDLTPTSALQSSISASTHLAEVLNSFSKISSTSINKDQPTIFFLDNANLYDEVLLKILLRKVSERNKNNLPTLLILTGQALLELNVQNIQLTIPGSFLINSFYLKLFDKVEIKEYINYRLYLADNSKNILFSDDAIQRIAALSEGLPRVINTICGVSIFQASLEELHIINEKLVDKASEFCFLAKDVEEQSSLKESIEELTEQFKLKSPTYPEKTCNIIKDKQIGSDLQSEPTKSKQTNASALVDFRANKADCTDKKEKLVIAKTANVISNELFSLSTAIQPRKPQSKTLEKPIKSLSKSPVFSTYRGRTVFLAVGTLILLFTVNLWEQISQAIKPDSTHIQLNIPDISDLADVNNALLITQSKKNHPTNLLESKPSKVNESRMPVAMKKLDFIEQYEELKFVDKGLLNNNQKKSNTLINSDKKLKTRKLKKNKLLLASAKKHNVLTLKPSAKIVHARNKKTGTSEILGIQELSVKKRASARYKLTQKGIRYDVESYFSSAEKGNNELLKLFLAANMPIDLRDKPTRNTILIKATKKGFLDVVTTALNNKAKVNRQNREGQTALITAAANGHYAISHKLLTYGANVHIRDNKGWDALLFAVQRNELVIVKELLKYGANKNTKNSTGVSALLMAKKNNQHEMLSLLETSN